MGEIKLIIFDLDGVLISSKDLHFKAFNDALIEYEFTPINYRDHIRIYDGLPTKKKIEIYFKDSPASLYNLLTLSLYATKQKITKDLLKDFVKYNEEKVNLIKNLKKLGYKIYIATNSIRESTNIILEKMGILDIIDGSLCNEDIKNPKPHPEIYMSAMVKCSVKPSETLVIEDSPAGLKAAEESYANVLIVKKMSEVNLINIKKHIRYIEPMPNTNKKEDINVLIPMAGLGSRFQEGGYVFPKPLIEINKEPMIKIVIDALGINSKHIFITQAEHYYKYNLKPLLSLIKSDNEIIKVDNITEGAACTALLAEEFINNDKELIIANSDQFVDWDSNEFLYAMRNKDADGGILTFESTHPKWSFAKTDEYGYVVEVAEKNPISNRATVGIYYWRKGSDFVNYAKQMIKKNIRTNNEFYICPIFNEAIQDDKKIITFDIDKDKMWGLGTPADLNYFLDNYKK